MVKLAIDLGSSVTKIYRADTNSGVVLSEPSFIALGENQEIKAIGAKAKELLGRTAQYTKIERPIQGGVIVDRALAVSMLQDFLSRIGIAKSALKKALVVISIPCGLDSEQLEEYVALAEECGLRKAYFVEQPYLAALGGNAALSETEPIFCLDIGGGVANAAVISANGIIAGLAINLGGTKVDQCIMKTLREEYKLIVGDLTAEKVKTDLGSLALSAHGNMLVAGSSAETFQPDSKMVEALHLKPAIRKCIDQILSYAFGVVKYLPAEVAASVAHNGAYLSGGLLKLEQAPQYIAGKLNMRYHIAEEPQFVTVLGGGTLLQDKELLERFARKI